MKTLFSVILFFTLSTQLFANDKYSLDFYNVERYNQSLPAVSLAITPQRTDGLQFILSYVSNLLHIEKQLEYTLNDKYSNVQVTLNYRF